MIPRRSTTLAGFTTLGLFWGAWASVLPSVQDATELSKGALGVALLFVSVGSVPAMFFVAAPLVARFGARAAAYGAAAFAAATTLPGLAGSFPTLVVALAAAGAASGIFDVAVNANAGRIESATGKRLMPLAHGLYSVGILVGAVTAGVARGAGAGREPILLAVSLCLALTALAASGDTAPVETESSRGMRLTRPLVLIGLLGAAAFVVEGGTESWSALFLARVHDASPSLSGARPGRLRRVDGGREVLRPGGGPARRPRSCSSAARSSALPAACSPRSARTPRSRSSASRSAARACR